MIRYHAALELLEDVARRSSLGTEEIGMDEAMGRILSNDLESPEEVPSFTNSAMDGFVVFSRDIAGASPSHPLLIPVQGLIAAGDLSALHAASAVQNGSAVEIMTGAPIPESGFDAVLRVEDVRVRRSPMGQATAIEVTNPVPPGSNIRKKGTDFLKGQTVLNAGTRLQPEHVLACASLGLKRVRVRRLPRIAILSTGSELVSPEETVLTSGMIRNSTGPFLKAALRRIGIAAKDYGVVSDDPANYRRVLDEAIDNGAEIVISTGAVSMGKYDFVANVLKEMGARTHFHKASIRPGKPILFSELNARGRACSFFGLPGNPVSTAVGLRFFVEPYIRGLLGLRREAPIPARLQREFLKPEGLRCFFKGKARVGDSGLMVEALKGQASYVVSALLEANCWVSFLEEGARLSANELVEIYPLQNSFERGVLS